MALTISSSDNTLELLAISMSWSMSADVSTVAAQRNTWFQSKHPSSDNLSVTFRNGDQTAQEMAAMVMQRWQRGNSILHLSWPEQFMDYQVTIKSFSWKQTYNAPVTDLSVSFNLLTNVFQTSMTDMVVSSDVIKIVEGMLENQTIDTEMNKQISNANKSLYDKWSKENVQFAGMYITYLGDGKVRVTVKKPNTKYQYTGFEVPMSGELAQKLQAKTDLYQYLSHLSGKD